MLGIDKNSSLDLPVRRKRSHDETRVIENLIKILFTIRRRMLKNGILYQREI